MNGTPDQIVREVETLPLQQALQIPANTQNLFPLPNPEGTDWNQKRMQRLEDEIVNPSFNYANGATIDQLRQMVTVGKIFPANARNLIVQRANILQAEGLPSQLFQTRRSDLPVKTAPDRVDYSPLDYLAASMPDASLFPLKAIQKMQYSRARNKAGEQDPVELRQKYRQGLMQVVTGLNSNSYDVKTLRGVSAPGDIIEIVEAAAACYGDPAKEELFLKTVTNQLRIKIDTYNKAVRAKTGNPDTQSHTSLELEELIHPENIRYMMQRIAETGKGWAKGRTKPAEVIPLRPNLEYYADLTKRNPYWFAQLSGSELTRRCAELERLLTENIENQIVMQISPNAARYIRDSRPTRYDAYLTKPFAALVKERVEQQLSELIDHTEYLFKDALEGGVSIQDTVKFLDTLMEIMKETCEEFMRKKQAKKTAEQTDTEVEAEAENVEAKENDDNILYFPTREKTPPKQEANDKEKQLSWQLAKLIELTELVSRSVSPELIGRFHNILRRIAEAQINDMVAKGSSGTEAMSTSDIYAVSKNHTRLNGIFRMFSRIQGEQKALQLVNSVIEEKLDALSDEEFAKLYADMFENTAIQGRQTFMQFILPVEFVTPGTNKVMTPNRLPNARRRLVNLLMVRPELFPERLVKFGRTQFQKETDAN